MNTLEQIMEAYMAEFGPKTCHERFLVQLMSHARWKMSRLAAMENRLFEIVLADRATPAQAKSLASFQKYMAAAERTYFRAFRELQACRKSATKAEADALIKEMHAIGNAPWPVEAAAAAPSKTEAAPKRL